MQNMKLFKCKTALLAIVLTAVLGAGAQAPYSCSEFLKPGKKWRPIPLWFWNNTSIQEAEMENQFGNMIDSDLYGGCAILPYGGNFRPAYLSEEYFRLYGRVVEMAREKGVQMSLYDEYGFPSGSMGYTFGNGVARFRNNHPGMTIKRLDKTERTAYPLKKYTLDLSTIAGTVVAVAAYSPLKETAVSLRPFITNGKVAWTPPTGYGQWKIMVFSCVDSGDPNVDSMNPDAVKLFIEDTHEQYYKHFPEAFGTTITSTFFDEPTTYRGDGRMWTEGFNQRFEQMYGFAPDSLYPALWYSLGEQTAAARCQLFSTRATLYAEGFMKTLAEWAEAHGIKSTGHQDQEEVLNATCVSGDLMLDGKYMHAPGIDRIGGAQPTENLYKVVSSSANNWDHDEVMSETYGAMGNISVDYMYQIAIEQYTKGINNLIPHAVWYNTGDVTYLPELSWRNPIYNSRLADFNTFLARMKYMLCRPGQHVADIAVLYPIQTLMGGTYLDGPKGYYHGSVDIAGLDYDQVSRLLTDELGRDFTYLHPEVLDDRCSVGSDGTLTMSNRVNTEHFHTIILPSVRVISISNLRKIEQAWEAGALVIFTTQTPSQTADGHATNEEIQSVVARMLESGEGKGRAVVVGQPSKESLQQALSTESDRADVVTEGGLHALNYIHKIIDGHHVYLFGNIDAGMTSSTISLQDDISEAYLLYPKTGTIEQAKLRHEDGRTKLDATLFPTDCFFLVEADAMSGTFDDWEHPELNDGMSYNIEMKVRVAKQSAGICFAAKDRDNYYMLQVNLEQDGNPRLRPHQWLGGGVTLLGDFSIAPFVQPQVGKAFKLRIEVTGSRIATTYIDGVMVDKRYGEFNYGMIGFREDHNNGSIEAAYFDDIVITDADGEELYRQNFSKPGIFSAGVVTSGWLYVEGTMAGAVYAWQQDYKEPATAIFAPTADGAGLLFDLRGMQVGKAQTGNIYIKNGKKLLMIGQ